MLQYIFLPLKARYKKPELLRILTDLNVSYVDDGLFVKATIHTIEERRALDRKLKRTMLYNVKRIQ